VKAFRRELDARGSNPAGRTWFYAPYDQLTSGVGPLGREDPRRVGLILVESPNKAGQRPYHKQKLALVLANQRHFALEQAERGVAVRYLVGASYAEALASCTAELGPVTMMEAAERELRVELAPLVSAGALRVVPHEGWLTTREDFAKAVGDKPPWKMDGFYRHVREVTGVLMDHGAPEGGRFSFDAENRKAWKGTPKAAKPPRFAPDAITLEVGELITAQFARHPGELDLEALPATQKDAEQLWGWALSQCLPHFGPYEDAMSVSSTTLFHTRISGLLNLHRLLPSRVVRDVEAADLPLASREGFIRQILGWREFVRHVHRETDGLRFGSKSRLSVAGKPGDGGYHVWAGRAWDVPVSRLAEGGARPNALGASAPMPPAYWGARSGLDCLDRVVSDVWREGYSHHITRLMILSNLATLLGIDPRSLTDWFWVAYIDAYDWVVEPNVLGMGTYATGDLMITKPYVSGAAYIDRMSDYCGDCAFDPKQNCPVTRLYWDFLARHADRFARNPRMSTAVAAGRKRAPEQQEEDARIANRMRAALALGETVSPETLGVSALRTKR